MIFGSRRRVSKLALLRLLETPVKPLRNLQQCCAIILSSRSRFYYYYFMHIIVTLSLQNRKTIKTLFTINTLAVFLFFIYLGKYRSTVLRLLVVFTVRSQLFTRLVLFCLTKRRFFGIKHGASVC